VTRLQKLHEKEASMDKIDGVVDELKTGLSSAYRQLRELLTTFRLKIDSDGLQQAFENTIAQLNNRAEGSIRFTLDYQIGDLPLTPNEEIHLMQIAREATQNALHHSQGESAKVTLFSDNNKAINLIIEDDGVGLGEDPEKLNHYGLAIMKERASQLGAHISITSNQPKGTVIKVVYSPSYVVGQTAEAEQQYTSA
jgi:two-component system nitrate/nitrite sensor histidine kinase NarX